MTNEQLLVRGPKDRRVVLFATARGGRWNGESWILDRKYEAELRQLLREIHAAEARVSEREGSGLSR